MYPMVIWFSASDWYQPLTSDEEERLIDYLEGGGRLYYNGQDYLFRTDGPNDFARDYLGVADYTEDFTSTTVMGSIRSPVGSYLGPYDVVYPYKNFSDALTPTASAAVAFVGQGGQPNAVTNVGPNLPQWRTTFFAFNPDGLNGEALTRLMQRIAGWLSWLGGSTVTADKTVALDTDVLTYTVVMRPHPRECHGRCKLGSCPDGLCLVGVAIPGTKPDLHISGCYRRPASDGARAQPYCTDGVRKSPHRV
jgi:hypothetical protein